MSHIARRYAPGTIQHVVARFINREFRFDSPDARTEYLRRLGIAVQATDWKLISYALMSSHPHLAFIAGRDPLARLLSRLHGPFARWLNDAEDRSGHVFEGRTSSFIASPERVGALISYIHNNPVRARLVAYAGDSTWSSHTAYVDGSVSTPSWLHVREGLEAAGFDTSRSGRARFDALVRERASDPRDPSISGETVRIARVAIRRLLGAPVEAEGVEADIGSDRVELGVRIPPGVVLRPRWGGDLGVVVEAVARATQLDVDEIRSRTQARDVVAARRLVVRVITGELGRSVKDAADAVGLTLSGASRLLNRHRGCDEDIANAKWIGDVCWRMTG